MINKNDDNNKDPYYISVKKLIDFDDIENTVNMLDNNYKEGNLNPKLRTTKKKVTFSSDKLRNRNIGSLKEMRNKKPLISVHRNNHIIVQGHRIKHATAKKSLVVTASRL
jgi:hypothetical protein